MKMLRAPGEKRLSGTYLTVSAALTLWAAQFAVKRLELGVSAEDLAEWLETVLDGLMFVALAFLRRAVPPKASSE